MKLKNNIMNYKDCFSLEGKTAVVTGGAGLLGSVQCKALSDFGATVAVCDIDLKKSKEVVKYLTTKSFAVYLNVENKNSIIEAKNIILDLTGRIDILINNAAIDDKFSDNSSLPEQSMFENYSLDLWNKSINVNLTGTFICCQVFGNEMAKNNYGSIINVASIYGIVAPDQSIYMNENGTQRFYKSPAYPAGKGAIINFTRYLASYWGEKGIRVNTLSPGGIENKQDEYFKQNYSKRTMLRKMACPSDLCGAVVFLSSDASSYVTGANLIIDGGWTAW